MWGSGAQVGGRLGVKVIRCRVSEPGRGEEGSCVGEWPPVGPKSPVGI